MAVAAIMATQMTMTLVPRLQASKICSTGLLGPGADLHLPLVPDALSVREDRSHKPFVPVPLLQALSGPRLPQRQKRAERGLRR